MMGDLRNPVDINDLLHQLHRDFGPDVKNGAKEVWLASEGGIFTFDDLRTKNDLIPKEKLLVLSDEGKSFLADMGKGVYDKYLSRTAANLLSSRSESPSTGLEEITTSPEKPPEKPVTKVSHPEHFKPQEIEPTNQEGKPPVPTVASHQHYASVIGKDLGPDVISHMKSALAGDVVKFIEGYDTKRLIQACIAEEGIESVLDLHNRLKTGSIEDLPKKIKDTVLKVIENNYMSPVRTEPVKTDQRERGYNVELSSDGKGILVDGRLALTTSYKNLDMRKNYLEGVREVLTLYSAGESIEKITEKTGKTIQTVRRYLDLAGITNKKNTAPPKASGNNLLKILGKGSRAPPPSPFDYRP
jgi:hypothetical protein